MKMILLFVFFLDQGVLLALLFALITIWGGCIYNVIMDKELTNVQKILLTILMVITPIGFVIYLIGKLIYFVRRKISSVNT